MIGTVVLPSLNRPHLLKEFFKSYKETESTVSGMVLVDHTDPKKEEYLKLDYPEGWKLILTQGITMGDKVREVWSQIINLDFVMILNDDHRPRTKGWDEKVIQAITGVNIVGTNDNWHPVGQRLCGAICYSGKVLRTLGWMFPPGINHLYHDNIWETLGGRTGCINLLPDVIVEHDHAFRNGNKDSTHEKVYPPGWELETEGNETWHFRKWLRENSEEDIQKLMDIQPKQGLMLATPSHDGTCSINYAAGLTDLGIFMATHGIYFEMARVVGSSLIPHARNSLVDMFLRSKCQKLLFIDADQGWDKESALILFQSNRRIIAGVTPHKRFPINLNFEPLPKDAKYFRELTNKGEEEFHKFVLERAEPNGEIEVSKAGTGFMMIDRSVFDLMKDHVDSYQAFDENPKALHKEFYKMGAVDKKYRGEDWKFCDLAHKLNIPIFINSYAVVQHSGSFTWGINRPPPPKAKAL